MNTTAAVTFENNATRSHHAPWYELVPKEAIDRLAARFELGAKQHSRNGWRKGGPAFVEETLRHLQEHLLAYLEGDRADDHLGAVLCNAAMLVYFEKRAQGCRHAFVIARDVTKFEHEFQCANCGEEMDELPLAANREGVK